MFYFEHQEKQNKLMKKRDKIGGGENINQVRKNRNQSWDEWSKGRITTRDLKKDSGGGQMFAAQNSTRW